MESFLREFHCIMNSQACKIDKSLKISCSDRSDEVVCQFSTQEKVYNKIAFCMQTSTYIEVAVSLMLGGKLGTSVAPPPEHLSLVFPCTQLQIVGH